MRSTCWTMHSNIFNSAQYISNNAQLCIRQSWPDLWQCKLYYQQCTVTFPTKQSYILEMHCYNYKNTQLLFLKMHNYFLTIQNYNATMHGRISINNYIQFQQWTVRLSSIRNNNSQKVQFNFQQCTVRFHQCMVSKNVQLHLHIAQLHF